MRVILNISILLLVFILVSCGKKPDESSPSNDEGNDSRDDRVVMDDFIKRQQLVCDGDENCPEYITKIIVVDNGQTTQCSGVLIGENRVLTSASCIPRRLRIPQLKCVNRIYAVFPESKFTLGEVAGCLKIEEVSNNLFSEQSLWKEDLLIFSLNRSLLRQHAMTSVLGMKDEEGLTAWKVDKKSDYLGVIKKENCTVSHNTYLNPFADHKFSPMQVVSDCEFGPSSTGTPLMRGSMVAGIYSSEMSTRLYNYLETGDFVSGKLGRYFHVSNTVCSRFLNYRVFRTGEITPPECNPVMSHLRLDQLRRDFFKQNQIHEDNMAQVQTQINLPDNYFVWKTKFYLDPLSHELEAMLTKPKCIFDSSKWIDQFSKIRFGRRTIYTYAKVEFSTPTYQLSTKLDKFLKPISIVNKLEDKNYMIEFNPYAAYVDKNVDVTITSTLFGKESRTIYKGITANCSTED